MGKKESEVQCYVCFMSVSAVKRILLELQSLPESTFQILWREDCCFPFVDVQRWDQVADAGKHWITERRENVIRSTASHNSLSPG